MEWMILPYKRYADFSGRSRRMEYWMFSLFMAIVALVLVGIMLSGVGLEYLTTSENERAAQPEPGMAFYVGIGLFGIWGLATFIPSLAVTVRRFHDRDMTGWWVLIFAVLGALPFVGWIASIAQIVFMVLPGTKGPNRFGDDPLDPVNASVFE